MSENLDNQGIEGYKWSVQPPPEIEMILAYRRKILSNITQMKLSEAQSSAETNQVENNREYLALVLDCDRVKRIMDQKNCHSLVAFFGLERDEKSNTDSTTIVLMGLSKDENGNLQLLQTNDDMFGEAEETWTKKLLINDDDKSELEFREFFHIKK